jgi:16S rRNA (guanine527-N7)-methyltransferase
VTGADEEPRSPAALLDVLAEARQAGFLGPGSLDLHLRHAQGFAQVALALSAERPARASRLRAVDLGSGGGLPGLVVAQAWPDLELALFEASGRRGAFLRRSVERLGLSARVRVFEGRAEELGRDGELRGAFDGVLARSFGKPAVVAECAAPLLRQGGWLVVSEPPAPPRSGASGDAAGAEIPRGDRWPAEGLRAFGLQAVGPVQAVFEYQALRQVAPCPERFPRRNGVPAKKPLF